MSQDRASSWGLTGPVKYERRSKESCIYMPVHLDISSSLRYPCDPRFDLHPRPPSDSSPERPRPSPGVSRAHVDGRLPAQSACPGDMSTPQHRKTGHRSAGLRSPLHAPQVLARTHQWLGTLPPTAAPTTGSFCVTSAPQIGLQVAATSWRF